MELLEKQSADLRDGTVKSVVFWVEKGRYEKAVSSKYRAYDFSEYKISEKDGNLVAFRKLYLSKKLSKVSETAYLQYKDNDLFNMAKYITVNDEVIYGVPVEVLVRGHHLYRKYKDRIDGFELQEKIESQKARKEDSMR